MAETALVVTETDVRELQTEASSWPTRAAELVVEDAGSFEFAAAMVSDIKALRKRIAETFDPIQKQAHAAWQEVITQRKKIEQPLIDADRLVAPKMAAFLESQERERRRLEAEATAAQRKADEEARAAEVAALEEAGEAEAAELVKHAPPPPPVVMQNLAPRVEGIGSRVVWKARVVDMKKLVQAVAEGRAPLTVLKVDDSVLNALARAMRDALNVAGVEAYAERGIVRR